MRNPQPHRRTRALAALGALGIAVALSGLAPATALAAPAGGPAIADGPYCPDHPDVPTSLGAQYLGSHVNSQGQRIDVYRVPNNWGFDFVSVNCDA